MENAFLTGLKGFFDGLHQFFEEAAGRNDFGAARLPLSGVDEHQFDVRGEAELAAAAFAQGEDAGGAAQTGLDAWGAIAGHQFSVTMFEGGIENDFGQVGELTGEVPKFFV